MNNTTRRGDLSCGIAEMKPGYPTVDEFVPSSIWESSWDTAWNAFNDNNMFSFLRTITSVFPKFNKDENFFGKLLANTGLKPLINRPHNLYVEHDDKGVITKYGMKIVYTPFSKDDVHVSVKNNNLVIEIGRENVPAEKNCVYCNISKHCEKIVMYLSDYNVDIENITAKCDDGILTVEIPVKASQPRTSREIKIV